MMVTGNNSRKWDVKILSLSFGSTLSKSAKPEKEKHRSELNYNILELKMTDKLLFCFYWGFCKASLSEIMRTVLSVWNNARRS